MKYHQPLDQTAPYGPDVPDASYVDGNPGLGIPGSIPPAAGFEFTQREIINFMTACGIVGTDADLFQLAEAVQSSRVSFGQDVGTSANTILASLSPAPKLYYVGMTVRILIANSITGATVIDLNSLGVKTVLKHGVALVSGVFDAGDIGEFCYDGTNFQVIGGSRIV